MPLIRARDLRRNILEMGYEKGMAHTLELALEQQVEMQQSMRLVTEMLDQCINEIEKLVAIGGAMKDEVSSMRRSITKEHDDGEHS